MLTVRVCPATPHQYSQPHSQHARRRLWRLQALLCGQDPSWGIAQEVCRLLHVSPVELEDPDSVHLAFDPAAA